MAKISAFFRMQNTLDSHQAGELKKELDKIPGVLAVAVSSSRTDIAVDYNNTGTDAEKLSNELERLGYPPVRQRIERHAM